MEAWDKKADLLEKIVGAFSENMEGITDDFLDLIIKAIDDTFTIILGKFSQDDFFANLATFNQRMELGLSELGYGDFVNDLLREVKGIDKFTVDTFKKINKLDVESFLRDSPQKKFAINAVEWNLRDSGVRRLLLQPITDILITNASSGISKSEATQFIKDYLVKEGKSELSQWAGVTATDALNQYNGKVNQAIKVEYNLSGWSYVGSIIKTSRAFCVECVGIGDIDENTMSGLIDKYSNGGLLYGMSTTTENITVNRGGFNCRHEAIPINI